MKHLFSLLAAAALLCSCFQATAQDDVLPDTADHGVPLQQVIKEWHDVGLYTAGWDEKPTIRNYFVGLAEAFPNDLFHMIVCKMLGLDVKESIWDYVLDIQNGYISGMLGTETSPSVQMCYWNCNDGTHKLVAVNTSHELRFKPGASVAVCRRGGATATFDRLNKYFTMMNMPLVSSQYWNIVYGRAEGEAALDTEGMQTMRTMADNMAWLLKKTHSGNADLPEREDWQGMNFIR